MREEPSSGLDEATIFSNEAKLLGYIKRRTVYQLFEPAAEFAH
jgi:hypothetical protein